MASTIHMCDRPRPWPGFFLTFEGGEGAGKSTQVQRLKARLAHSATEVVTTREPGGSPRAEAIRTTLLGGEARPFGAFAETALFAAARADHVDRTIRPALDRGATVLCDRFTDSTWVYQGDLVGSPTRVLAALEQASVADTRPDLTLIFDLPAEAGLARADRRRAGLGEVADRFESEGLTFHRAVRDAFLRIAREDPSRCRVIDASASPDDVEREVWRVVEPLLGELSP